MAIQMRRGSFTDFDPSKMLPGEWAVMLSGDDTTDGYAVYICYQAGVVRRVVTSDELSALSDNIYAEVSAQMEDVYNYTAVMQAASAARVAAEEAQAAIEAIGDISELAVPLMSSTTRGGAKLGEGLVLTNGALGVDPDAIVFPTMSASRKGAAKLGSGLAVADDALSVTPVTTTQVDDIVANETVTGDESLSATGLAYFWGKLKAWAQSAFAAISHTHAAGDVTSGTLSVARGGTGVTTAASERNRLGLGNTTDALPVANGGTGLTSSPSMLTDLASTSAANVMAASPRPGVTGTLPVDHGGTGATSASGARTNLSVLEYASGVFNVGGTSAYLLFKTTAIASFSPPTGITACMVLDTSDNGLYWYTA